jgi:hypothetical protein
LENGASYLGLEIIAKLAVVLEGEPPSQSRQLPTAHQPNRHP